MLTGTGKKVTKPPVNIIIKHGSGLRINFEPRIIFKLQNELRNLENAQAQT